MTSTLGYRALAGTVGLLFVLIGLVLFATFFGYQQPGSTPAISTGPMGHYFVAFTGCALVAWGGMLLNGARRPAVADVLATPTALGLAMMAVYRMVGWIVGDYHLQGDLLRVEAGLFLLLALAFMWLKPNAAAEATTPRSNPEAT